jgi:imidazolonepropionase-like amidohydrolase
MALKAGADTIEHMVFHDDETVDMLAESGVWMTPTLLHRTDHAIQTRLDQGTSQFVINKMKALQSYCYETFQKMHKTGVNIAMGTDMGYDPEMGTNARELEVYVKLGMTPMDAILSATRNGARALKLEKDLGTVEAGKFADIIAVNGDPLKNIAVLQEKKNIQMVMKEGHVYADRRPGNSKSVVNVAPGDWQIIDYL